MKDLDLGSLFGQAALNDWDCKDRFIVQLAVALVEERAKEAQNECCVEHHQTFLRSFYINPADFEAVKKRLEGP